MGIDLVIEFDHRIQDHLRARRLYYSKKSRFAKADKVVALFLLLFGVVLISLVGARWWTLIWFVLAPIEWFDLLSIEPLIVHYVFKRTKKFQERTRLEFHEAQIHYKTPSINSTLEWDCFSDLLEDDELFLLVYKAPRMYAVIPKRAFGSDEDRQRFRELAFHHMAAS